MFQGKFPKNFDFLGDFTENFDLPGKNWLFTAISGQIILFLFKSHHFRNTSCTRQDIIIFYDPSTTPPATPPSTPHDPPFPKICGWPAPHPLGSRLSNATSPPS